MSARVRLLIVLICVLTAACGRKGELQPPVEPSPPGSQPDRPPPDPASR